MQDAKSKKDFGYCAGEGYDEPVNVFTWSQRHQYSRVLRFQVVTGHKRVEDGYRT